eukprot:jgi/Picre1/31135/NNA_006489.t1
MRMLYCIRGTNDEWGCAAAGEGGVVDDASIRSIRLHLIDADKHEFYVNAVVESTFEYPFSKFEEHAKQEGWLQETQGVKYVLEGDPIDPAMNTPHDFDLEDGDIKKYIIIPDEKKN